MKKILKSNKLNDVCYEIRGPLLKEAERLEMEGYSIIKLNTGNPPAFGMNAPDEIIHDVIMNMKNAQAYGDAKGLFAVQTSLFGYQSLQELIRPGGRLYEQRNAAYEAFSTIEGLSCVKPMGALYLFPRIDIKKFNIKDDQKFLLDFLKEKHVLMVQGTGFNWKQPDHFRVVFLPTVREINKVATRMAEFLADYKQKH